jgi:hypothetical protein
MKIRTILTPLILIVLIVAASCEPWENASEIPEIRFKSYTPYLIDTLGGLKHAGDLVFSFTDGDADFGFNPGSTGDSLNLVLIPYQKVDHVYDSIESEDYVRKFIVKDDEKLHRDGEYTTIKGEIQVQIIFFITPPFDTMRYDFYIIDRAGHKSNVESTTDIGF